MSTVMIRLTEQSARALLVGHGQAFQLALREVQSRAEAALGNTLRRFQVMEAVDDDHVIVEAPSAREAAASFYRESVEVQERLIEANRLHHQLLVHEGRCQDPFEQSGFQCVVVPPTEIYVRETETVARLFGMINGDLVEIG